MISEKEKSILKSVHYGLEDKITLTPKQKEVLDNFVVCYMQVVTNNLLSNEVMLPLLDERWENLFEVEDDD